MLNRSQQPSLATDEVDRSLGHCVQGVISCCSAPISLSPDTVSVLGPWYNMNTDKPPQVELKFNRGAPRCLRSLLFFWSLSIKNGELQYAKRKVYRQNMFGILVL